MFDTSHQRRNLVLTVLCGFGPNLLTTWLATDRIDQGPPPTNDGSPVTSHVQALQEKNQLTLRMRGAG